MFSGYTGQFGYFTLIAIILFSVLGCKRDETLVTKCLKDKISFLEKHYCDNTANISKYIFQNEFVYLIDPGFCADDQSYEIINSNCEVLGTLAGFIGNTKINGVDFYEKSKFVSVVWQKLQ